MRTMLLGLRAATLLASLALTASLCAGCSAAPFPEAPASPPPLPQDQVLLATFSGEVDPVAGTVTIETLPAPAPPAPLAGLSKMVVVEGTSTLTVSIDGAAWNNTVHAPDCGGALATGANVQLTPGFSSPVFFAGVYAEITAISSGTGLQACDMPTEPPALASTSYGYWYYGTISPGVPVTRSWNWKTAGGSRFTFSGRLVGVKGTTFTTGLGAPTILGDRGIAWLGDRMVYAVQGANYLQFVALDGSSPVRSENLQAAARSVAADTVNGLVWFTTVEDENNRAWAGYVNTLDRSVVSFKPTESTGPYLDGIVVDPDPGTGTLRAWFYSAAYSTVFSMTAGATPTFSSFSAGFGPTGLVFPSDGNGMLVSRNYGGDAITRFSRDGTLLNTYDTLAAGCGGAQILVQDASSPVVEGKVWFSGEAGNAVCSLSASGVVTRVADVPVPHALTFDGGGNLWAISRNTSGSLYRVTPAGGTYALALPGGNWALTGIARGPDLSTGVDHLWVGNGGHGLLRLEP